MVKDDTTMTTVFISQKQILQVTRSIRILDVCFSFLEGRRCLVVERFEQKALSLITLICWKLVVLLEYVQVEKKMDASRNLNKYSSLTFTLDSMDVPGLNSESWLYIDVHIIFRNI
jgi:hypothetical protein